jgi:site-specific recombinase XerC
VDAYGRVLRQLAAWISEKPGGSDGFRPELLTRTAVEGFLSELEAKGHGPSHRAKAKSAISGFATWLVEEKGMLRRNPTRAGWRCPRCRSGSRGGSRPTSATS